MRWMRAIAPPALAAAAVGFVLSILGLQSEFAWGWALLAGGIVLVVGIRMPDDPRVDAPGGPAAQSYIGSDVSRLAWAIDPRTGVVNEAVTRRVRATLKRRLARLGIDVDDDAQRGLVEKHLGEGLWARLTARRVTIADIRDALAAAEQLVSERDSPNPTAHASRENTR